MRALALLSLNAFWLRWRWSLLVGALVFLILSIGILNPGVWKLMGIAGIAPAFSDMEALLAAGEAWAAGHDPYLVPNLFDSGSRPHIYGPAWLITGAGGFTVAHIAEFSVLTILFFLGSLAYWYRPESIRATLCVLAVLFAPSILLGLERANNDLIIVILISLAAGIGRHKGRLAVLGVILLLATAAWLKLYPLVAGLALLALPGGLGTVAKRMLVWGVFTLAGFWLYAHDYLRLLHNIPVSPTIFAYDLRYAFTISVRGIVGLRLWTWAGGLFAGGLFVGVLWRHRREYWTALPLTGPWAFFTVSAASIWVGCLMASPSYPYRAVWLLPLIAWGASPLMGLGLAAAGRALCLWILLFLWVWWLQWQCQYELIDRHYFAYMPIWAAVVGLTQASVLLTTGLIAWLLLGWGWRRMFSLIITPPSASVIVIVRARKS